MSVCNVDARTKHEHEHVTYCPTPTMSCVLVYCDNDCLHEHTEYQGRLLLGSREIMQTYLLGLHPKEVLVATPHIFLVYLLTNFYKQLSLLWPTLSRKNQWKHAKVFQCVLDDW